MSGIKISYDKTHECYDFLKMHVTIEKYSRQQNSGLAKKTESIFVSLETS